MPSTATVTLTPFEQQVKRALRLYDSPERLAGESPLASAYFLSRALRDVPRPVTTRRRGEVLCAELRAAAAQLWGGDSLPATREELLAAITHARRDPDDPRYSYIVLELRCFQTQIVPNRTSDIWEQPHLLPGSKSQHYRDFDAAVKRLAALLLERLRPAVRAERPRPPEVLYGYDWQLDALTAALARGATVILQGAGGVGKTSVGAAAIEQLGAERAFWYTLRPGFNDGPSSLLFALGAFLFERGATHLWQYLVTANGVISDLNLALGLVREDLAGFMVQQPILCIDDLEHLQTGDLSLLPQPHAQLLDLIDGLRGSAPLLLISQRPLPPGDLNLELGGLSVDDLEQFWHAAGRQLSRQQAEQLHRYTAGNPRLLTLLLALHQHDEEFVPDDDPHAFRSLLPAFQRLWRRLSAEERRALQRLAVYLGQAPEDVLPPAVLESLARLRLIERDGDGGVALLPVLAPVLRQDLSPDLREALHREAAIVRLERGEYTAAAFHFVQGGQEDQAVQLWFPVRQQAIARGEADTARLIFSTISRQRLDKPERKALDIIRAELHRLVGQYEEGLRELEQVDWSDESEASARLWTLRGEMQEALGYPDLALTSYAQGLQVTTRLLARVAELQQSRGVLYIRRSNRAQSSQELRRAEFALEWARGLLRDTESDYNTALECYFRARALADELDDDALRALAEGLIARVYGRRQQLEQALEHASRAIAIYERLGDRVNFEKMRSMLSLTYVQARQFQAVLEVGLPAYTFFVAARDPHNAAMVAANLAEASYELGDFEAAQRYATAVLGFGQRFAAPYAHFTLGQMSLARQELSSAETHFKESIQLARQNEDFYMVAYAQRALATVYRASGAPKAAQQHLAVALGLFRQLEIPGEISACEDLMAELQAQQV